MSDTEPCFICGGEGRLPVYDDDRPEECEPIGSECCENCGGTGRVSAWSDPGEQPAPVQGERG